MKLDPGVISKQYIMVFGKNDTSNPKFVMKSIKTNPNSAKRSDKVKFVNNLHYILLTTLELSSLYFFRKKKT